jgi:alcohol dehydrogenase class IV
LPTSKEWEHLLKSLERESVKHSNFAVEREPSPDLIDETVAEFGDKGIEVVVACGGGVNASPMTDALAWSGLERVSACLAPACAAGA